MYYQCTKNHAILLAMCNRSSPRRSLQIHSAACNLVFSVSVSGTSFPGSACAGQSCWSWRSECPARLWTTWLRTTGPTGTFQSRPGTGRTRHPTCRRTACGPWRSGTKSSRSTEAGVREIPRVVCSTEMSHQYKCMDPIKHGLQMESIHFKHTKSDVTRETVFQHCFWKTNNNKWVI